ncbi:MAG: class I SAM-dependent DNA methyltransferase, partial [Epsilonproteobacteria bacterium]|nr:class I SAM-dependent DNA methyltransferase [Campylobacterota bacterium]
ICISSGVGTNQWRKNKVELLLIPKISQEEQQPFIDLVDKIMELKAQKEDTKELENQIDRKVYELYGLSEEEIKVVEEIG